MEHPVVKASIDIAAVGTIIGWWVDAYPHFIGVFATTMTAGWYIYKFYQEFRK